MIRLIALPVDSVHSQINVQQPGWKKEHTEKSKRGRKCFKSAKWTKVGEED